MADWRPGFVVAVGLLVASLGAAPAVEVAWAANDPLVRVVEELAALGDRSTGSPGAGEAADLLEAELRDLGLHPARLPMALPVLRAGPARLTVAAAGLTIPVQPLAANAIAPGSMPAAGLAGPLVYGGRGELADLDGRPVAGAIVLLELDSGNAWLTVASLGALAVIYLDRSNTDRLLLADKLELSPLTFPRFWLPVAALGALGEPGARSDGILAGQARLTASVAWQEVEADSLYALVPGADPRLAGELLILETFYDSTATVLGASPGADEALGIATLLASARRLVAAPPARSVLLVASAGHAQAQAGMRQLVWAVSLRAKELRDRQKELQAASDEQEAVLAGLAQAADAPEQAPLAVRLAVAERIKTEVDDLSGQLMRLRMEEAGPERRARIEALAGQRLVLRRLGWRSSWGGLPAEEKALLAWLVPRAKEDSQGLLAASRREARLLKAAASLRRQVGEFEIAAAVSLHLSSHGQGLGAFHSGFLYALKPQVNRTPAYSLVDRALAAAAAGSPAGDLYRDTLRPSQSRSWQSHFLDRPALAGEVSALAGLRGLTLATVHDGRSAWGTPYDLPQGVDWERARHQARLVHDLVTGLAAAPSLAAGEPPPNGFSVLRGRAKFLRHGELFADQPAPGTVVLAFQGPARFHAMVDARGGFELLGVADKRHVLDKVILEAYRFDPATGETLWAVDKKRTGKDAYRVKMQRRQMETDLVMFACRQLTLFDLLEPRTLRPLTKIELIDGRRETLPVRYWYSRIDTRVSTVASIFLEPGTPLKLTLSDTILRKKMILLNSDREHPEGRGYLVDDWPVVYYTAFRAASDMWHLLGPRIDALEERGVVDERIRNLRASGREALAQAMAALSASSYSGFVAASNRSLALASRVYDQVDSTGRDVLFGVLFYIALFAPFAFCLERLTVAAVDIHRRILAFTGILVALIALVYRVHPAFQLAYSPLVVIGAFFILGLSLLVTAIIVARFETEMAGLQRRARHQLATEISRGKAMLAALLLGVSNLRRRRLRTALTCTTLVILTFTIMSFTTVKGIRHHARLRFAPEAGYQGLLVKNVSWQSLPPQAADQLAAFFGGRERVGPRVWLEDDDPSRALRFPVRHGSAQVEAQGLLGLAASEPRVTGLDRTLVGGRWLKEGEMDALLLPAPLAQALGIDPAEPQAAPVEMWGRPFRVVGCFAPELLERRPDLDGESLTPVIFPGEAAMEMTEAEMEALESGEEVRAFHSRCQHVPAEETVIASAGFLLAAGGHLKGLAARPPDGTDLAALAHEMADRFGLALFTGEPQGTFLYHASDTLGYSGVPNIVVPVLIAIFIVLNTMISSVFERRREIGIYTSVGLAPSHVGFLFIAEALALAILSVVIGYLLAQTSARLFAGTPLWAGITVNYSSLSGVAAMLLVMAVVLVSALYPARVAAAIAIPDVNRAWSLPPVTGNELAITLPFLMRLAEHESIGGFIYSYLMAHRDVSHGLFSTGELEITQICPERLSAEPGAACVRATCPHPACLHLHARVWLAPFDFGIMQRVDVQFCPAAEAEGYLEIRVRLVREAGEANVWLRMNRAFLHALRKELLVWRSLDVEAHGRFAEVLRQAEARDIYEQCRPAGSGLAAEASP
ncbi:MAG: ABC transporter permease [Thermodesulfobacteriota bacterium]